MLASSGELTPPTQWITRAMVTLRVGFGVVPAGAGVCGDAVADGDLFGVDEDVLDEQPQHALAVLHRGGGCVGVEPGEESFQVVGEFEVGVLIGGLRIVSVELPAEVCLPGSQVRHPGAQLIDGYQLLGERLDHGGDRCGGLGEGGVQSLALAGDRVGGAGGLQTLADLGPDQRRVGEQAGDVFPYNGVEVVGADRPVVADPAALEAVVVRAEAPVVVDRLVRGPRGGAVVAVSACRAGGQTLQQGRHFGVAGCESLVVGQPLLDAGEGLFGHDCGDGNLGPLFAGAAHGSGRSRHRASLQTGDAVQPGRFLDGHGLAEHRPASVGGVMQHAADHRPVPAVLAGASRHALAGQPASQVGDGGAVVGVAAEQLGDQRRLVLEDLVGGPRMVAFAQVPVAEWGTGEHVDRPGAGTVDLAAPVALHQLGFLILGEHALELHQQLVFGGVAARAVVDELHPHPSPGELLDQQRLVGKLAGQPVRGIDQHHVQAALGGQVPQRLQARTDQRGAGVSLVLEHPLRRNLKPVLRGMLAQRRGLRADRLVLLLPGRRHPGVDRRADHGVVFLPGRPALCEPGALAPRWCKPPTDPWPHDGRTRTPPRLAGRSPAWMVSAPPREELLQRLRHHRGDRDSGLAGMLAHPRHQGHRQLDGEYRGGLGRSHTPGLRRSLHIAACLPDRTPEPPGQAARGLRRRDTRFCQLRGRVDTLGVLTSPSAITRHDINVLPVMSLTARDTPRPFQSPVTERDLKAEVIHCVGGVLSPLLANIALSVLDEHFCKKWDAHRTSQRRDVHRKRGGATYRIVRYADDFVIMVAGTKAHADALWDEVAEVIAPLGLRLSAEKSRVCHLDEGFDFLGFRIQRRRKKGTTNSSVYTYPSKKALLSIMAKVRALTKKERHHSPADLLGRLNPVLRGWCAYFRHGVSKATSGYLDSFVWHRVTQWLLKRHKQITWAELYRRFLTGRPGNRPAAEGIIMFDAAAVPITRYRWRANNIPTPWISSAETPVPA